MDFQSVQSPTNYGAPNVFQSQQGQQGQGGQQQQGQQGQPQQGQLAAVLQKAKQMLSQGLISADQYNGIASKFTSSPETELATSAGNMGSGMGAGAPMNILPPGAGG